MMSTRSESDRVTGRVRDDRPVDEPGINGGFRMLNLLVVDDDVAVLRQIESAMSDLGELRIARTGAEALTLAHQSPPDLILLDLQLGDTNGLTLLQQLRGQTALASVPVIFVSSERDPAPQIQALGLDATDWVSKPLDPERLRARVRAALDRSTAPEPGDPDDDTPAAEVAVLAVDDDPIALQAIASALTPGTFSLRSARNATDAIRLAQHQTPEVILIDVFMPGVDGFALATTLMTLPEVAEVPIIFITQHGARDVEVRALRMGAFDFVSKPFAPEILRARVGNAVRMRRRSLRALERSEAHWRRVSAEQLTSIVAQAREPIIVLDPQGQVVLANAAARALGGDAGGLRPLEALPATLRQVLTPALLGGAQALASDLPIRCHGGRPAIFDVTSIVTGTGSARLVTLTFHDQTPRRQAEVLERDRIRLESEARARQLMTSYLMHEIGNPLNGVIGLTQLMLSPGAEPLTATQRQRLSLIAESGETLRRLMSDALDLARHEAGRFSVKAEEVPVRDAIEGALQMAAPMAQRDEIELAEPSGDLDERVRADPVRLRQCLDNLLGNACKYGGSRGRVSVSVLRGDRVTSISVSDRGPGLEPAQIERLFVPFDRLGAQVRPGHGLGLSVTRMLVQAMGGRLEVASEPGVGSRFTLVLPRADAAQDRAR